MLCLGETWHMLFQVVGLQFLKELGVTVGWNISLDKIPSLRVLGSINQMTNPVVELS